MSAIIFIAALSVILSLIYAAAFKILPAERWQVFASIPVIKAGESTWRGVNITYYGLLTATGYTLAISVFILMMASAGIAMQSLLLITFCVLAVFIPSAKIMAYIVEKKKHTITVGGAVFVMIIAAPWIINGVSMLNLSGGFRAGDSWVFLSSMITAYAFGEGFGRLACISFGCCYGRPVSGLPAFLRKIFSRVNFVYHGKTKKIAYHDNLDGVEVVPVQAITAVLYTMTGLAGLYFFFEGNFIVSFFLSLTVTQIWRFASEFLRADYRGNGLLSAYQKMSLLAVPYYVLWYFFTGTSDKGMPVIADGLWFLWNPGVILVMILMWAGCLFYTGISSVTSSMITIYVNEEKI